MNEQAEDTTFKRRNTMADKRKTVYVTNHQRTVDGNYTEMPSHTNQYVTLYQQLLRVCGQKRTLKRCRWDENWSSHYDNQDRGPSQS